MSRVSQFKDTANQILDQFDRLVATMPFQGNTSDQSQKMCLMNGVGSLRHMVNGVVAADFREKKDAKL